jgi:glyoxylase-like metal-dependent hydrolase (beta-lactamase superfamily II)
MPRELADGVFWLGDCLEQRAKGKIYHSYNAAFLLCGTEASMLIETGHPKDFPIIERQLRSLLVGRAPLKYLFVTHQETPHSGELGRVLARYPEAILCGDMSDYHLAFPQFADRMLPMISGDDPERAANHAEASGGTALRQLGAGVRHRNRARPRQGLTTRPIKRREQE